MSGAGWQASLRGQVGGVALSLSIGGGARPVALVGPNGAGKTTVLRTLAGALRAPAGRIEVGGRVLFDAEAQVDLPPEARGVGYVPQGYGLFPHLRVLDNVAFGLRGAGRAEARAQASAVLARMGCGHLASRWPAALSGGEQQRVALARALAAGPRLLLLDEPLAALDVANRRAVRTYLAEHLAAQGTPALVVTHDVRDIVALGAEVFVLEAGRVVQRGRPEALAAAPVSEFVAELFEARGVVDQARR